MLSEAGTTNKIIRVWWDGLPEKLKQKIMKRFFPDEMGESSNANKVFNNLSGNIKLWFYECMRRNYWNEFVKGGGNLVKEKKWKAIKINKTTREATEIGQFYGRENAINALSKARSVDPNNEYEYCIESKF